VWHNALCCLSVCADGNGHGRRACDAFTQQVKMTTKIRVSKKKKTVSKGVAYRKKLSRFGDAKPENANHNISMVSVEQIFLEKRTSLFPPPRPCLLWLPGRACPAWLAPSTSPPIKTCAPSSIHPPGCRRGPTDTGTAVIYQTKRTTQAAHCTRRLSQRWCGTQLRSSALGGGACRDTLGFASLAIEHDPNHRTRHMRALNGAG
jgi:hypothetical protein